MGTFRNLINQIKASSGDCGAPGSGLQFVRPGWLGLVDRELPHKMAGWRSRLMPGGGTDLGAMRELGKNDPALVVVLDMR